MFFGATAGSLEVRKRGSSRTLRGSFPTGRSNTAVLSDGGRTGKPKKEYFKSGSFTHSIDSSDQEIYVLSGHEFSKPLASKLSETAKFWEDASGLQFEARLGEDILSTSYAGDLLAQISSGIVAGVSIGFRVPPQRTVPDAERVFEEPPEEGDALIRELSDVILYEVSIVTSPAYKNSTIEARSWELTELPEQDITQHRARYRRR